MEAAMTHAAQTTERPGFVRRFAHWWRNWNGRRWALADLDCCGSAEVERIARDVGVSGTDLSILAGKWPDAADLLYWRMNEIKLDRKEITQADPQVTRDLQRVHDARCVSNERPPRWQLCAQPMNDQRRV
jgi:hypothetical protein